MTKMLYFEDPYLKESEARVVRIEGNRVLLDATIFFPQTSTEPGDSGKINQNKVVGLKKEGEEIWHILNKPPDFAEGDTVHLQIDWDKRYRVMRLHTALHLWAGVFDVRFQERAVAGVVKPDSAYLVFKHELPEDIIRQALDQANSDIQKGTRIETYWDEKRKGFRWCRIESYPPIPCGGPHLKNSGEIQKLVIKEKSFTEGKQKITVTVE